jgi:amino-acid N-acetyltransferase
MTAVRIEPAREQDFESLCAVLAAADLPTDGLAEHLGTALVALDADAVVGCVALERYGDQALLRSLAVVPWRRGDGVGRQLTRAVLDLARRHRVATVYLLTMTAADFFARHFDFRVVGRPEVAMAVQQSIEFTSACPRTAQAMVRRI